MTKGNRMLPLLKVKDLQACLPTKHGLVRAVNRVSFSLEQGRTLGLVGESGSGKSMLARAVMGLLPSNALVPPDAIVEFKGQNLIKMSGKQMRRIMGREIALVFQDPMTSLNPVMKIGRQVAEVLCCHLKLNRATAWERAISLLDIVGIPMPKHRAEQYPHQLSGGLRQRVAIAIALACEPKLLIADEPTTALDVTVQAEILDLLARLQQEKQMAMILITHDLNVVAGRTHETAVMYAGRIVEHAPTSELFKQMHMPYTRALMEAIPRLSNPPHTKLQTINGHPPDLIDLPRGCSFAPRCCKTRDLCTKTRPDLKPVNNSKAGNHRAACWYPLNIKGE
ncbi:ABC transporter ATP-binding protein [Desulfobacterales bacterium HSG17]|nr:ABC transporter ATP-binding protein [Desulfobacterales bacterium HSG17]